MCYTRRDQGFEEEARGPRVEEDRRSRVESERPSEERREEKPLTEKVKEMVGARSTNTTTVSQRTPDPTSGVFSVANLP